MCLFEKYPMSRRRLSDRPHRRLQLSLKYVVIYCVLSLPILLQYVIYPLLLQAKLLKKYIVNMSIQYDSAKNM